MPGAARADDSGSKPSTWYVVGGPDGEAAPKNRGSALDLILRHVDVDVSRARLTSNAPIAFTSGATSPLSDGYAFFVTGVYDFDTGTLVTPRIVGGIGVGYRGAAAFGAEDPTSAEMMSPGAQIGVGADFDLGDNWAVSAEYRAMYLGETERDGRIGESLLDQKFTVGAKIRF